MLTQLRPRMAQCTRCPILAEYKDKMATVLAFLDRPQEALRYAAESLDLVTGFCGPEAAATLTGMHTYAVLLIDVGRLDEGTSMLARVLATQTRVLGADHDDTRRTKHALDVASAAVRA
mmetsp:Transcript_24787/g.98413  ORF Transcript_24787/g.98413 Transcript_24787/m.98413 type:complete len:119 (+) Transcript_24787:588-944(+)